MNKAIGYIRAQTEDAADNQQSTIFSWAMSNNIEVATFYRDIGTSAAHIENSPALAELLGQVEADSVESIIVVSQDRLSRNYADWQKIIQTCEAHGCAVRIIESGEVQLFEEVKAAMREQIAKEQPEIRRGSVVQIDPSHDDCACGFITVTEVNKSGITCVKGFFDVPDTDDKPGYRRYVEAPISHCAYIGEAEWLPGDEFPDEVEEGEE